MRLHSAMMLCGGGYDRRCSMPVSVQQSHPIAHLPLVLGVLRRLEAATVIDGLIAPPPPPGAWALVWAWGRSLGARDSGWASCPLQGGEMARRAWHGGAVAAGPHACRPQ